MNALTRPTILLLTLLVAIPFIILLAVLGQLFPAFWVTPEMLRLWGTTPRPMAHTASSALLIIYLLMASWGIVSIFFRSETARQKRHGLLAGTVLAVPVLLFYLFTHFDTRENEWMILALTSIWLLYSLWGLAVQQTHRTLVRVTPSDADAVHAGRRQFLQRTAVISVASTAASLGGGWLLNRERQREVRRLTAAHLPDTITAQLFPITPDTPFPEMVRGRFQPAQHPLGVCFSGGGLRAYSAGLGQLRALYELGLLQAIGALSCVSGGALMGTIFSYAPTDIDDATLLGPIIPPEQLTLDRLATLDPQHMAASLRNLTDVNITAKVLQKEEEMLLTGLFDQDKIYARVLNDLLLAPYGLGEIGKLFTLDTASAQTIIERNPALTLDNFYTMRPDRPYLIVGASHVYPLGINFVARHFEYTPLYIGTPQRFPGEGIGGKDFGGGFVESFAFDARSAAPSTAAHTITATMPRPPFLLSDMIGSTSAAPGAILNKMGQGDLMPAFYYWPIETAAQQAVQANEYSFIDGGQRENLGIVPLLYRQYPVILAFINSGFPIDVNATDLTRAVDFSIGRLFGYAPAENPLNIPDSQVFPREQFPPLVAALQEAKKQGQLTMFRDTYRLVQPNPFDIPSYPNDGEVTVIWFYNDLYQPWLEALPAETRAAMQDPAYNVDNFPHFKTVFQNNNAEGLPELFYLSAEQINLLSQMWSHAVLDGAGDLLQQLPSQFLKK